MFWRATLEGFEFICEIIYTYKNCGNIHQEMMTDFVSFVKSNIA